MGTQGELAGAAGLQSDVLGFRRKFGLFVGAAPALPDVELAEWWAAKLMEEAAETAAALGLDVVGWAKEHAASVASRRSPRNLTEVADGCADVVTCALHVSSVCGFDFEGVWAEVHRSNMEKEGDGAGNVWKPAGWRGPDVRVALGLREGE